MRWTVGNKLSAAFGAILVALLALALLGNARDARVDAAVVQLQARGVVTTQDLGLASVSLYRIRARSFYHVVTNWASEPFTSSARLFA